MIEKGSESSLKIVILGDRLFTCFGYPNVCVMACVETSMLYLPTLEDIRNPIPITAHRDIKNPNARKHTKPNPITAHPDSRNPLLMD